ncbi:S1 family peptidase [Streptomyces sp. URMC 124]|uniref:S1 family peptidase n=1 Tax=Streptomyces sp. URMC 124 TaxID=3423405 RepID=UPI003F1BAA77
MSARHPRATWAAGLLLTAAAASTLTAAPAHAVVGQPVNDSFAFTAKLDIAGERSCSAALVAPQWLATAGSCFTDAPGQGAPKLPEGQGKAVTAIIGRPDLTRDAGATATVTELVPRTDRDLVLAKLDKPVTNVTPVSLAANATLEGQDVWVSGYGRTKDEWVPDRLHYAKFATGSVKATTVSLAAKTEGAAICQGDTGGPAFRDVGGRFELIGVNSRSWQGGCQGTDAKETRTNAVDARVDDLTGWIRSITSPPEPLRGKDWKKATNLVPGYFTGGAPGGDKRRMDLFVTWEDGTASLFQGADSKDPKHPFTAEHKLPGKSWHYAKSIAAGNFTGSGTDGLVVRWQTGQVTWFAHVDQKGFSKEEELKPASAHWADNVMEMAVGRYTGNAQRDDLLIRWKNGSFALHTDIGANGLKNEIQLMKANAAATNIVQMSAGDFTGKATSDLLVRWTNGSASIYRGVSTAKPFEDELKVRPEHSAWRFTKALATGAFAENARPNDVLVRWEDGNISLYPAVDASGTHDEVELLK